jgi:hypothetical protein
MGLFLAVNLVALCGMFIFLLGQQLLVSAVALADWIVGGISL